MTIQTGVGKKVVAKKESTWGTKASAGSARYLRRVTSDIDLSKDTYASSEIVSTYQISDFRHGTRKVGGSINGELSPGAYLEFMQSALRRDFTTISDLTAVTLTVASGAVVNGVQTYTLTRSAGNWYTDGVRTGMVIRITTGLANAANINKNLLVQSFTSATVIVLIPLNGVAMAAEGPTSSTVAIPGKLTYTPATGHTNDSYSIEHVYSDITQSEVFTGCRISTVDVNLPASGIATVGIGVMGKDVEVATAAYFTTPTASSTKGVVAAVNGVVRVGALPVGILTGLSFKIDGGLSSGQVVGSVYTPDVFVGRVNVTGQFTAYFDGVTQRDAFLAETEIGITATFATGSGAAADFITFALPRVKLGGATKSDGEQGLILTCPFQALYNSDGSVSDGDENTTLWIQDSNGTMA
jgi:Phage tail tube protein